MDRPAHLVPAATGVTLLKFPIWFSHVVASDWLGLLLPAVRNGLLVAATLLACRRLWQCLAQALSPAARADTPATAP